MKNKTYKLELWNGKKVIGHLRTDSAIFGKFQVFPIPYARWPIVVPLLFRTVVSDGVTYTCRRCLDVRKKSKRQIELLKKTFGG